MRTSVKELMRAAESLAHLGSFEANVTSGETKWTDGMFHIYDLAVGHPLTFAELTEFIHPDDRERVVTLIRDALAREAEFTIESRIVRRSGEVRILLARGRVERTETGERSIFGCCQDVTDQVQVRERLRLLATVVESSNDAILTIRPDQSIASWNPGAERMFGFTADEIIGQSCVKLVAPERRQELAMMMKGVSRGDRLEVYELEHVRKDGTRFFASVSMVALRDRHGNIVGASKTLRDVDDRKRADARLHDSLREKDVLLREIHHRVKNNLQVVSSLLALQVSGEVEEETRRRLLDSQHRIQSLALVHELLYHSEDLSTLDLAEYLQHLVSRFTVAYNLRDRKIAVEIDAVSVPIDIDRAIPVGLIVNELMTNALIHAFPAGQPGTLAISLVRDEDLLTLSVRDDGIGMPPEINPATATSLGLQIAQVLTRQLHGKLTLKRIGGTCMTLRFAWHGGCSFSAKEVSDEDHENHVAAPR